MGSKLGDGGVDKKPGMAFFIKNKHRMQKLQQPVLICPVNVGEAVQDIGFCQQAAAMYVVDDTAQGEKML